MKSVKITSGCITCGRCEFLVPEVFEVTDVARVKKKCDLIKHKDKIKEACKTCPVGVILCEDKDNEEHFSNKS